MRCEDSIQKGPQSHKQGFAGPAIGHQGLCWVTLLLKRSYRFSSNSEGNRDCTAAVTPPVTQLLLRAVLRKMWPQGVNPSCR